MMDSFAVKTRKKTEIVNITAEVERLTGISEGAVLVHIPHTTAGLILNEDEANLKGDMEIFYGGLADGKWAHNTIDNNAEAHLAAGTLNSSLIIPVSGGKPVLGTWQSILLVELDGPRDRKVYVRGLNG